MSSKPRDSAGNDLIVSATATAMVVAKAAGLENDIVLIKKLADGFYFKALEKHKNDQNRVS